jgi:cytochrome c peroxidase
VAYRGNGRFAEVTKRKADRGAFRTPALRNLGRTAPYMDDGHSQFERHGRVL